MMAMSQTVDMKTLCDEYTKAIRKIKAKIKNKTLKDNDPDLLYATAFSKAFEDMSERDQKMINQQFFFEVNANYWQEILKHNEGHNNSPMNASRFLHLLNTYYESF